MGTKMMYWAIVIVGAVLVIMPKFILQVLHEKQTGEKSEGYEPPVSHRLGIMALGAAVLILGSVWYAKYGQL